MKETLILIFVLIFALYTLSSPNWGDKKYTVYEQYCPDIISSSYIGNCTQPLKIKETTFLAIIDKQEVIEKNSGYLKAYKNCTVYDAENWECVSEDYGVKYHLSMKDGNYIDLNNFSEGENTYKSRQVGRPPYFVQQIGLFFQNLI